MPLLNGLNSNTYDMIFLRKKRNTYICSHYASALESLPIPSNCYRIAIWPSGCLRSSMQKKDRDCGDNAQRDEDKERDPHANRNAVAQAGYDRAADQASLRRHSGYSDKAFSSFLGVLA
jgi:hypothetical protein